MLTATVRVMHQRLGPATPPQRHHQGVGHQLRGHDLAHRPPHHPARVQVEDYGHVQPVLCHAAPLQESRPGNEDYVSGCWPAPLRCLAKGRKVKKNKGYE
jgi:hypothetical protein